LPPPAEFCDNGVANSDDAMCRNDCTQSCPQLEPGPEIHVSLTAGNAPGSVATFSCTDGPIGDALTCHPNGRWSGEPPQRCMLPRPTFTVTSGSCSTASESHCIRSANYPSSYQNGERCEFTLSGPGSLSSTAFSTESCCDHLHIGGASYSGGTIPTGVLADVATSISWSTDGSVTRSGWEVCASAVHGEGGGGASGTCSIAVPPGGAAGLSPQCGGLLAGDRVRATGSSHARADGAIQSGTLGTFMEGNTGSPPCHVRWDSGDHDTYFVSKPHSIKIELLSHAVRTCRCHDC
jgi:hypothetical protein